MDDQSENASPLLKWSAANPLTAASIAGGSIYLLVFENYRAALQPFGISPSEVGVDYATAVWPAVQVVAALLFLWFTFRGIASLGLMYRDFSRRALVYMPLAAVLLVLLALLAEFQFVSQVWAGKPYRPLLYGRLSLLSGLRAELVTVVWKEPSPAKPALPSGDLLFLGGANGVALIFEPKNLTTWRLPSTDILVTQKANWPRSFGAAGGRGEE